MPVVNVNKITKIANTLRRHIVSVSAENNAHLGGSMSSVDLMAVLYFYFLRFEKDQGHNDHFLLSKGHCVHALHACMVEKGEVKASDPPFSRVPTGFIPHVYPMYTPHITVKRIEL